MKRPVSLSHLVEKMLQGDRRALAQLISTMEQDPGRLPAITKAVYPHAQESYCIGVTGPPGAGKSTIIDGLVQLLRGQGVRVGVLAVDPTSPISGGAVLGDRIRMQRHYLDQGVFIRSLATRGIHGGLSRVASASVKLLGAFGMKVVLVETVGVGQTELDVMKVADTVVITLVPEAGDSVQAMKAGLMEIGDIFVVNKADREGAGRLVAAIKSTLSLGDKRSSWKPPVLLAQAHKGEGIQALYDVILAHRSALEQTSALKLRRRQRQQHEFVRTVQEAIGARVADLVAHDPALGSVAARVEEGELDPYTAAAQVLGDGVLLARLAAAFCNSNSQDSGAPVEGSGPPASPGGE